jgi:hypothetical protein
MIHPFGIIDFESYSGSILFEPVRKLILFRLIKNAPAFAEAASRRQADAS